jgi:hypothetical protein
MPSPTTLHPIISTTRTAKFKDAFKAGYKLTPVSRANLDNTNILDTLKTCVRLTRTLPTVDYTSFFNHCLVSVNGFYHLIDTDGTNGIVVVDAMKSLKRSNQNQIGVYSFSKVCALQAVPIVPSMIDHTNPGIAKITLPMSLTNKTVLMVIGGYLHFQDTTTFTQIGLSSFQVNFNLLPTLDRFYESRKYLDLSSLPLQSTINNTSQVALSDFLGDANITALLGLSQSFMVVLDNPSIFVNRIYIRKTGLPNLYIAYKEPVYPLITGLGRAPEYWSTKEDGQYALSVYDNLIENRVYNTMMADHLTTVDSSTWSFYPGYTSGAYMLEVGSDTPTIYTPPVVTVPPL